MWQNQAVGFSLWIVLVLQVESKRARWNVWETEETKKKDVLIQ